MKKISRMLISKTDLLKWVLFVTLICLATAAPSRALAIGEIERVGSWLLNGASFGTLLAEIEAEKSRMKGDFARRRAEFDLHLERTRADAAHKALTREIEFVRRKISDFRSLVPRLLSLEKDIAGKIEQLSLFRMDFAGRVLSVDLLAASVRAELEIGDSAESIVTSLGSLAIKCRQWSEASQHHSLSCIVIGLLVEDDAGLASRLFLTDADLQSGLRSLMQNQMEAIKQVQMIEIEIQGLQEYLFALEKRLERLS